MFVFLIAGHEVGLSFSLAAWWLKRSLQTTAHTLCFTFGLLALFPDEQERLYQHIKGVMSSLGRMPVRFEDPRSYNVLTLSTFLVEVRRYESLHILSSVSSSHCSP